MATEAEGITLLSMYGDDEEYEESFAASSERSGPGAGEEMNKVPSDYNIRNDHLLHPVQDNTLQMLTHSSPILPKDGSNSKNPRSPLPQPIPSWQQRVSGSQPSSPVSLVFPTFPLAPLPPFSMLEPAVGRRVSRAAFTIVDYAHDEAAMSPETEEEEIDGGGFILFGTDLQGSDGHSEGTTIVTSQTLIPNSQYECLQPSDVPELSKIKSSMAMDCTETEREVDQAYTSAAISDLQKDDPLQKFLSPEIELQEIQLLVMADRPRFTYRRQEKINKFLAYKRAGKSFNADLRKRKDYRNPDFLQHAVRYQDIEQIGTCFGTEVFDPHGYDKRDFYDEIEADMKREMERKVLERKKSLTIDFVSGGIQSGEAAPSLKMNNKIPAVGVSAGVNNELQPVSTTLDAARDSKLYKKSKWDME